MIIKGEAFYFMERPSERAVFGIPQVQAVLMQQVELDLYEVKTDEIVSTRSLFFVIALLANGEWVATKPNEHQDFVATIANELADKARQFNDAIGQN